MYSLQYSANEGVETMDLMQSERLLCEQTQEYMKMLYRQSKITGSVQINFVAARLGLPSAAAAKTARFLEQSGMLFYEKYGRITLTEEGKHYVRNLLTHEKTVDSAQTY